MSFVKAMDRLSAKEAKSASKSAACKGMTKHMAYSYTERLQRGENGTAELTARGVGDPRVALFNGLVRGMSDERLAELVGMVLTEHATTGDVEWLVDLVVMAFQTRHCRGGKGERLLALKMVLCVFIGLPGAREAVAAMVDLLPHYGYWKDPVLLVGLVDAELAELGACDVTATTLEVMGVAEGTSEDAKRKALVRDLGMLRDKLVGLIEGQLVADWRAHSANEAGGAKGRRQSVSLCSKYMPREKSALGRATKGLVRELATRMFVARDDVAGGVLGAAVADKAKRAVVAKRKYRKMLADLGRGLQTVETLMSTNAWDRISPERIPSLCMSTNRKAFLNEKVKGRCPADMEETGNRHPDDEARVRLRQDIRKAAMAAVSGDKGGIKGKVLFPHKIVECIMAAAQAPSAAEQDVFDGQWAAIKEEVLKQAAAFKEQGEGGDGKGGEGRGIDLGKCVSLVDVSGSMYGDPVCVAVALGILVSEIAAPAFRNRFLTFETKPQWVKVKEGASIVKKVQHALKAGWGGTTDFEKALTKVLDCVKEGRLAEDEVPDLIVFSDMQFNSACTVKKSWELAHARIVDRFAEVGKSISGKPYKPPTIIYWNLRGGTRGSAAAANTPGVRLLSGFSPHMMKLLLKGSDPVITPLMTVRAALDDKEYDVVRARLEADAALRGDESAFKGYTGGNWVTL